MLIALLCAASGCEKRVVGMENRWVNARPQIVRVNNLPASNSSRSVWDEIGDFLFGWTKHLGDDSSNDSNTGFRPPSTAPYSTDTTRDRPE